MNTFLSMLLGFLLAAAVVVTLYFTVLKKDICAGGRQLYDCPSGGVSICTKPGMDYASYCKGGGSKGLRNLGMGPGNGQCVEPTDKTITDINECNICISNGGQQVYWSNREGCKDAYTGSSSAIPGDIVAFDYGPLHPQQYTCSSPGVVC